MIGYPEGGSTRTFHCVMRDRYPVEANVLRIHINSACSRTCRPYQRDLKCEKDQEQSYLRLKKDARDLRIETNGQEGDVGVPSPSLKPVRVLRNGQRVKVDNREIQHIIGFTLSLQVDPGAKGAQIVSKMRDSAGLDPREYDPAASWGSNGSSFSSKASGPNPWT
jgi:hypothetical protein